MNHTRRILIAAAFAVATHLSSGPLIAQHAHLIHGSVADATDGEPLIGVHVAVWDSAGVALLTGTITDSDGTFQLNVAQLSDMFVRISTIGYHPSERRLSFGDSSSVDLGLITLVPALLEHDEVVVEGERMRASRRGGSTVYHVSEHLADAVPSGVEMLRMVPGVHVDLMRNISVEGSDQIVVMVNDRERDASYLSQLGSQDIASIEITQPPPPGYPADITAVLNIRLHDRAERHISGHVHLEAPTSTKEIYAFPSYRLTYGGGGTTLFTAYNGDFSFFDVDANSMRSVAGMDRQEVTQQVRQENWSHRFHYGVDQRLGNGTDLSFYGQINPHSFEQNGSLLSDLTSTASARRRERDRALGTYHAATLNHRFDDEQRHQIILDVSLSTYARENETLYGAGTGFNGTTIKPRHQQLRARADYVRPISDVLTARTGIILRRQELSDGTATEFRYDDAVNEAYLAMTAGAGPLEIDLGVTGVYHEFDIGDFQAHRYDFNPQLSVAVASTTGRQVRISGRRSVRAPHIYQINPTPWSDNPLTRRRGDPRLRPSVRTEVSVDFAAPVGSSFLSTGAYYAHIHDDIQMLIAPSGGIITETAHNVGQVREYGARLSGSIRLGRSGGIQPIARVYYVEVESDADEMVPVSRSGAGAEIGLSAYASFGSGYTVALSYQREGRGVELHRSYHSHALYFLSFGKSFDNGFKLDLATGLPFARRYTYRGQDISAPDVTGRTNDFIKLSAVPLLVHLTYTFSRGQDRAAPQIREVDLPVVPERGM